jgi:hypothetical protein
MNNSTSIGRRTLSSGMSSFRYQLWMLSGNLYREGLVRTDVSETVSSPSSGLLKAIEFHSCVTVQPTTVDQPLQRGYHVGSKNTVLWDAFTAVSIKDVS